MADDLAPPPAITDLESASLGKIRALLGKVKILGFLLAIVTAECGVAAFLMPSAAETEALATAMHGPPDSILPDEVEALASETPQIDKRELPLGQFGVTSYQPLTNTTLRIDFQLYGTVAATNEQKLQALLEDNQHRFREQVLVILRSAEMTDLTDAGLGLIKRKILEKTNRLLGEALVEEVIFSDFSFIEQ